MDDAPIRRRAIVRGRVQGVGFRWTARSLARRLDLTGFVTNRADGSVEVEAEGSSDAVAALIDWLRHGTPGAEVDAVEVEETAPVGGAGFSIL